MQSRPFVRTHRKLTPKCERERDAGAVRVLACGPLYARMTETLTNLASGGNRLTKADLLKFAHERGDPLGLKVDRLARRLFTCAICWFCEYMPTLVDEQPNDIGPFHESDFVFEMSDSHWEWF
jgi:hypothetical protein